MSTTLTLDASGGLFLPAVLLERAHLQGGGKVQVDVTHGGLILRPLEGPSDPVAVIANDEGQLVRKGRFLVFGGGPEIEDAEVVEALKAARHEQADRAITNGKAE